MGTEYAKAKENFLCYSFQKNSKKIIAKIQVGKVYLPSYVCTVALNYTLALPKSWKIMQVEPYKKCD